MGEPNILSSLIEDWKQNLGAIGPERLRTWGFGGLAFIAAAVALSMGALYVRGVSSLDESSSRATAAGGRLLKRLVADRVSILSDQTRLLADLPALREATLQRDAATTLRQLRYLFSISQADGLIATDHVGQVLAKVGRGPGATDQRDDSAVRSALHGTPWKALVFVDGMLCVQVSMPVYLNNYPKGVVVAYSEVGTPLATTLREALGSDFLLVAQGSVVGSSFKGAPAKWWTTDNGDTVRIGDRTLIARYANFPNSDPTSHTGYVSLTEAEKPTGLLLGAVGLLLVAGGLAYLAIRWPERRDYQVHTHLSTIRPIAPAPEADPLPSLPPPPIAPQPKPRARKSPAAPPSESKPVRRRKPPAASPADVP